MRKHRRMRRRNHNHLRRRSVRARFLHPLLGHGHWRHRSSYLGTRALHRTRNRLRRSAAVSELHGMDCLTPLCTTSSQHQRMKGRIVRIDKTARQKGTPSWVKELLYVDEVDDAKPTDKSDATSEGSVRDPRICPKSNAERATEHGNDLAFFSLRKITERLDRPSPKRSIGFSWVLWTAQWARRFLRRNHDGACLLKGDFSAILRGGSVR